MSAQAPTMLLEIKVISATDLPPLARMLRTYVVACLDHENKSQTTVDRHGGTNPTWNQKFAFYVDDRFLNSKTSEIKFEIYNIAWLRDLPMGTASLAISSIFPALSPKNPGMRSVALRIRRPTGHLQGILNVGVQVKDNYRYNSPPGSETGSAEKVTRTLEMRDYNNARGGDHQNMPRKEGETSKIIVQKSDETASLLESITTSYEETSLLSCVTEEKLIGESKGTSNNNLLPHQAEFVYFEKDKNGGEDLKSKMAHTTIRSVSSSGMHRLTSSEIAAGDYYWGGDVEVEDDCLGNSIFESWIVAASAAGDGNIPEIENIPLTGKDNGCRRGSRKSLHRRSQSELGGRGLFSLCSMKLKLICGCNSTDKKKRQSRRKKMLDDGVDDHTAALLSW